MEMNTKQNPEQNQIKLKRRTKRRPTLLKSCKAQHISNWPLNFHIKTAATPAKMVFKTLQHARPNSRAPS